MRDTGDMMDDAEDTMMECSGDEALYDLIDLSTDISHSAPTIKDAAERLLTLLGVDDDEDDIDEDALSSSEDEGVELDEGSDDDEDDDEPENTRLLHQLAASLAQELKYSHKTLPSGSSTRLQRNTKMIHDSARGHHTDDQVQCMEVAQEICHPATEKPSKFPPCHMDRSPDCKASSIGRGLFGASSIEFNASLSPSEFRTEPRGFRIAGHDQGKSVTVAAGESGCSSTGSWAAGWDACAAEAVRYLVEEEGLSPHHPTVIAMKSHLEVQRERALAQYTM